MKPIKILAFVAAFFCAGGSAMAERPAHVTLTAIVGDVRVDIGNGFVPVSEDIAANLKSGDRVMVAKGGSAVLNLGPNCSVPLESPSMTTVAEAGCIVGTQNGDSNGGGGGGTLAAFLGSLLPVALSGATSDTNETSSSKPMSPF